MVEAMKIPGSTNRPCNVWSKNVESQHRHWRRIAARVRRPSLSGLWNALSIACFWLGTQPVLAILLLAILLLATLLLATLLLAILLSLKLVGGHLIYVLWHSVCMA